MIEIKDGSGKNLSVKGFLHTPFLFINNYKIEEVKVLVIDNLPVRYNISCSDYNVIKSLGTYKLNDFINQSIEQIEIFYDQLLDTNFDEILDMVLIPNTLESNWLRYLYNNLHFYFKFRDMTIRVTSIDSDSNVKMSWNLPFSYSVYLFEFLVKINQIQNVESEILEETIKFPMLSEDTTLQEEMSRCINLIKQAHKETWKKLEIEVEEHSLTIPIKDFPRNVRVACKQYLQYFEEFLRDLGINSRTNLEHNAGEILFTVTPQNKKISLDKIRTALEVYLELPKSPLVDEKDSINSIREIKYIQEINSLKMKLSQSEMQTYYEKQIVTEKERIIQVLNLLTKSIIEENLHSSYDEKLPNEKKKLLRGTIELGKLKVRDGFEIDIPKFLENTKLDAVFDQLEEFLNNEHITQLKLNE